MKEKTKITFVSPVYDFIFKTLVLNGSSDTKKYINRVINYALDNKKGIEEYELTDVEYGEHAINSLRNRSDLIYIKKDKTALIDVELNRIKTKISLNRNRIYLHKLASDFYTRLDQEKPYTQDINVKQININNYICEYEESKNVLIRKEIAYDIENNICDKSTEKIFIYLPIALKMWYDGSREEMICDMALLSCKSFEEMVKVAGSNKERKAVISDLKDMIKMSPVMSEMEIQQYEEVLHEYTIKEATEKATKEGIEKGIEQGIEQGIEKGIKQAEKEMILKLSGKNKSPNEISELLDIEISKVQNILNEEI